MVLNGHGYLRKDLPVICDMECNLKCLQLQVWTYYTKLSDAVHINSIEVYMYTCMLSHSVVSDSLQPHGP